MDFVGCDVIILWDIINLLKDWSEIEKMMEEEDN